jgi:hypothetical protein
MKQVTVRYSVTFEATINVADNATPKEIGEELSNLNIPEDGYSRYVTDTFNPVVDENGDPEIFCAD